jgi:hypothetical protein
MAPQPNAPFDCCHNNLPLFNILKANIRGNRAASVFLQFINTLQSPMQAHMLSPRVSVGNVSNYMTQNVKGQRDV